MKRRKERPSLADVIQQLTTKNTDKEACSICQHEHETSECPLIVNKILVTDTAPPVKAFSTLPSSLECGRQPDGSYKVFAKQLITRGTQFGPLDAPNSILKPNTTTERRDSLELMLFRGPRRAFSCYLDPSDRNLCNWMILVNRATELGKNNLICYQLGPDLYFTAVKDIKVGDELIVDYSPGYGAQIKAQAKSSDCPTSFLAQRLILGKLKSGTTNSTARSTPSPLLTTIETGPDPKSPVAAKKSKPTLNQCTETEPQPASVSVATAPELVTLIEAGTVTDTEPELVPKLAEIETQTEEAILVDAGKYPEATNPDPEQQKPATPAPEAAPPSAEVQPVPDEIEHGADEAPAEASNQVIEVIVYDMIVDEEQGQEEEPIEIEKSETETESESEPQSAEEETNQDFVRLTRSSTAAAAARKHPLRNGTKIKVQVLPLPKESKSKSKPAKQPKISKVKAKPPKVAMTKRKVSPPPKASKASKPKVKEQRPLPKESRSTQTATEQNLLMEADTDAAWPEPEEPNWVCKFCAANFSSVPDFCQHLTEHYKQVGAARTEKFRLKKEAKKKKQRGDSDSESDDTATDTETEDEEEEEDSSESGDEKGEEEPQGGEAAVGLGPTPRFPYTCDLCLSGKVFNRGEYVIWHLKKHSDGRLGHKEEVEAEDPKSSASKCPNCGKMLSKLHFPTHSAICSAANSKAKKGVDARMTRSGGQAQGVLNLPCPICITTLKSLQEFRDHVSSHTHPYMCTKCELRLHSRQRLKDHVCTRFICDREHCGGKKKAFQGGKLSELLGHIQKNHKDTHYCFECAFPFASVAGLKSHTQSVKCGGAGVEEVVELVENEAEEATDADPGSENEDTDAEEGEGKPKPKNSKSFVCEHCGMVYTNKHSFKTHRRLHQGKRFECEECGKAFSRKDLLQGHMYTHQEATFECQECNKKFKSKKALANHASIHSGVKKFKCDQCDLAFVQRINMITHQKVHLSKEQRGFQCKTCLKFLASEDNLSHHIKVHENTRAFACRECPARFASLGMKVQHEKCTHRKLGAYGCEYCPALVKKADSLQRHLRKHHLNVKEKWDKEGYLKSRFKADVKVKWPPRNTEKKKKPLSKLKLRKPRAAVESTPQETHKETEPVSPPSSSRLLAALVKELKEPEKIAPGTPEPLAPSFGPLLIDLTEEPEQRNSEPPALEPRPSPPADLIVEPEKRTPEPLAPSFQPPLIDLTEEPEQKISERPAIEPPPPIPANEEPEEGISGPSEPESQTPPQQAQKDPQPIIAIPIQEIILESESESSSEFESDSESEISEVVECEGAPRFDVDLYESDDEDVDETPATATVKSSKPTPTPSKLIELNPVSSSPPPLVPIEANPVRLQSPGITDTMIQFDETGFVIPEGQSNSIWFVDSANQKGMILEINEGEIGLHDFVTTMPFLEM